MSKQVPSRDKVKRAHQCSTEAELKLAAEQWYALLEHYEDKRRYSAADIGASQDARDCQWYWQDCLHKLRQMQETQTVGK